MTLADVEAVSRETLTPWKEELLWRLYVDTYNFLTLSYGDEVIDRNQAAHRRASSTSGRPISRRRRSRRFSRGCRGATCSCSRARPSIGTSGCRANLGARRGPGLARAPATPSWELTVLTHDQPFLFSNISGVLSSFGMDILRGFAFTKPDGLVVDMFHFSDEERFLELNPGGEAQLISVLEDVIARTDRSRRPPEGPRGGSVPAAAAGLRAGHPLRQRVVAPLHHRRDRGRERARPALPHEPGDVGVGLRRRPGADCHRRAPGDRRVPPDARTARS